MKLKKKINKLGAEKFHQHVENQCRQNGQDEAVWVFHADELINRRLTSELGYAKGLQKGPVIAVDRI